MVPWYIWFVIILYFVCRVLCADVAVGCCVVGWPSSPSSPLPPLPPSQSVSILMKRALDARNVHNSSWTHMHTHTHRDRDRDSHARYQHNSMRGKFGPNISFFVGTLYIRRRFVVLLVFNNLFIYRYELWIITQSKRNQNETTEKIIMRNRKRNQKRKEKKKEKKKEKRIYTMAYHSRTFVICVFLMVSCVPFVSRENRNSIIFFCLLLLLLRIWSSFSFSLLRFRYGFDMRI